MTTLVYVAGAPATGKSTLMAALTAGCAARVPRAKPFAHDVLADDHGFPIGIELGRRRPDFPGTDALSMSVSPLACQFMETRPAELVLAEGDRLATQRFLDAAQAAGYDVHLVYLVAPKDILDLRCVRRGSSQNPGWRRGRATKAERLAYYGRDLWGNPVQCIDTASLSPERAAAWLRRVIPALRRLPEPAVLTHA